MIPPPPPWFVFENARKAIAEGATGEPSIVASIVGVVMLVILVVVCVAVLYDTFKCRDRKD